MDFSLNAQPLELYVPTVKSGAAYRIWQVVTSTAFEYFILFLITVNTLILMMKVFLAFKFKGCRHIKFPDGICF